MQVVLATSTMYGSLEDMRVQLALKTTDEAHRNHYPIVTVDNSPESVKDELRIHGALVHNPEQKGMGAERRQAIREAAQRAGPDGIVVWLEPEKWTFVPLLEELLQYFSEDPDLDLIVPRRKSLASYPEMQQLAEALGREGFRLATGHDLDITFGPRVFRTRIAHFFLDYKGTPDLWDATHVPVMDAIKAGHKVTGVSVDYTHPEQQQTEDTLAFYELRVKQLHDLAQAMAQRLRS